MIREVRRSKMAEGSYSEMTGGLRLRNVCLPGEMTYSAGLTRSVRSCCR